MLWQKILFGLATSVSIISLGIAGCTQERTFETETQTPTATTTPQAQERKPDVPFVPTPQSVVNAMLELAQVSSNDVLYDLGSGDGRIPITAVQKYNVRRAVGVEINPDLVQKSQANAKQAGISDRVEFRQQDLFQTDLGDATVVTLYLLPDINIKLRPKLLQELKPGTRIVSHDFDMGEWKPQQVVRVEGRTIYLWVVPENVPQNLRSGDRPESSNILLPDSKWVVWD
jgi:protein-L-isoaspartate O-methyltransferase